MEGKSNRRWQLWLGISIGLISLAAVFYFYASPAEIFASLRHVQPGYLLITVAGITVFLVIRAIRWRFMLGDVVPFSPVFHIQNIGYMLSQLLPFRLGDVARAVLIGNVPPVTIPMGVSTMVVERLLDMLFIVVLLPFTLSAVPTLPDWMRSFALVSGFIAVAGVAILILAANLRTQALSLADSFLQRFLPFINREPWLRRFDELLQGLGSLTSLRDGAILLVLSVAVWVPIVIAYYSTMLAVGIVPTWIGAAFVVCAAAFSVAVPSTPGQIGPFHFAVTTALQLLGEPATESASFAFVYHGINLLTLVAWGAIGIPGAGLSMRHVMDSTQSVPAGQQPTPN